MPIAQRSSNNTASCMAVICFSLLLVGNALAAGGSHFVLPQLSFDSQELPVPPKNNTTSFIVYDGASWGQSQNLTKDLSEAASHPRIHKSAKLMPNGDYVVRVSPDGHYYLSGEVNGFPVRFMVDSGAATSSLPMRLALDAGIRVGVSKQVKIADGPINIGETSGNVITIAGRSIANTHIMVIDKLETALLGAEVLNMLDLSYSK
jgi:aspartyl protease family protein